MAISLFRFKVFSLRQMPMPNNAKGITQHFAIVKVSELPEEFKDWNRIRMSDSDTEGEVAKKIEATIKGQPDMLPFLNKGIVLTAERVGFDTKKQELSVEMSDKNLHGLIDGRLTFAVIRKCIESGIDTYNAYVQLEIISGMKDEDEVSEMAEYRLYS